MANKEAEKPIDEEKPAPVEVKASVPLEVKIIRESIEALGGNTETPPGTANPTPVIIIPDQPPIPTVMENTAQNPINVTTDKPLPVTFDPATIQGLQGQAGQRGEMGIEGQQGQTGVQGQVGRQGEQGRRGLDAPGSMVTKGEGVTLAPTTTEQEDTVTAGQRLVNMTWEFTQSFIAITVVGATMAKAYQLTQGEDIPTIMAVAFGTIVGFYFARTNHQSIGGVGKKASAQEPYMGR